MRDNISLIFASMAAIIVLVLLPLLSIFARQDNISSNVVYNIVSNFVDNARYKGYFTGDEYNKLKTDLATTGKIYNVDFEVHKNLLIKTSSFSTDEYVQDTLVYYTTDVLKAFIDTESHTSTSDLTMVKINNIEQYAYVFKEGDELYVRANTTGATIGSLLYSYFTGNIHNNNTVDINYGGKIYKATRDTIEEITVRSADIPSIQIDRPVNLNNVTPQKCIESDVVDSVTGNIIEDCITRFDLSNSNNKSMKFHVTLKNFTQLYDGNEVILANTVTSSKLSGAVIPKIDTTALGFSYDNIDVGNITIGSNQVEFDITFNRIYIMGDVLISSGRFVILDGLGGNELVQYSPSGESEYFQVYQPMTIPAVAIIGPSLTVGGVEQSTIECGRRAYFKIEYYNLSITDAQNWVSTYVKSGGTPNLITSIDYENSVLGVNSGYIWVRVTHDYTNMPVENIIRLVNGWGGSETTEMGKKYTIVPTDVNTLATTIYGPYLTIDENATIQNTILSNNDAYFMIEYTGIDNIGTSLSELQTLITANHTLWDDLILQSPPEVLEASYSNTYRRGRIWVRVKNATTSSSNEHKNNYIALGENWNESNGGKQLPAAKGSNYEVKYATVPIVNITGPYQNVTSVAITNPIPVNLFAYFKIECKNFNMNNVGSIEEWIADNVENTNASDIYYISGDIGEESSYITIGVKHTLYSSGLGFSTTMSIANGWDGGTVSGMSLTYAVTDRQYVTNIQGPFLSKTSTEVVSKVRANQTVYFKMEAYVPENNDGNYLNNLIDKVKNNIGYTSMISRVNVLDTSAIYSNGEAKFQITLEVNHLANNPSTDTVVYNGKYISINSNWGGWTDVGAQSNQYTIEYESTKIYGPYSSMSQSSSPISTFNGSEGGYLYYMIEYTNDVAISDDIKILEENIKIQRVGALNNIYRKIMRAEFDSSTQTGKIWYKVWLDNVTQNIDTTSYSGVGIALNENWNNNLGSKALKAGKSNTITVTYDVTPSVAISGPYGSPTDGFTMDVSPCNWETYYKIDMKNARIPSNNDWTWWVEKRLTVEGSVVKAFEVFYGSGSTVGGTLWLKVTYNSVSSGIRPVTITVKDYWGWDSGNHYVGTGTTETFNVGTARTGAVLIGPYWRLGSNAADLTDHIQLRARGVENLKPSLYYTLIVYTTMPTSSEQKDILEEAILNNITCSEPSVYSYTFVTGRIGDNNSYQYFIESIHRYADERRNTKYKNFTNHLILPENWNNGIMGTSLAPVNGMEYEVNYID